MRGVARLAADLLAGRSGPAVLVTHSVTMSHLRGQLLGLGMDQIAPLVAVQGGVYRILGSREEVLRADKSLLATAAPAR